MEARWTVSDNRLSDLSVTDLRDKRTVMVPSSFSLRFSDGSIVRSQDLHFRAPPTIQDLKGQPNVSRLSDEIDGKVFEGTLENETGDLCVDVSFVLRDGSNYFRQIIVISAPRHNLAIHDVRMIDLDLPDAQVSGTVAGSPIGGTRQTRMIRWLISRVPAMVCCWKSVSGSDGLKSLSQEVMHAIQAHFIVHDI